MQECVSGRSGANPTFSGRPCRNLQGLFLCKTYDERVISVLYQCIEKELLEQKSLAALIYLLDNGRELECELNGEIYFITKSNSPKYVSLWHNNTEQSFKSIEELLKKAVLGEEKFLSLWEKMHIVTLF